MKIIVYGAGNIGCLYAARLSESGQDVTVLARGQRLRELREHGIRLEEFGTGRRTVVRVPAVERLQVSDDYELVLVALPRQQLALALAELSRSSAAPNVLFFGNNVSGPGEMVEALGRDRVLLGFPGAAAARCDRDIRYLICSKREQPTTIGELEGTRTPRLDRIARAFAGAGFPVSICSDMDAWLKTHAAEISPTANALYMAGGDPRRLARTRDAVLLMLRAIREGYAVLRESGTSITPAGHRVFEWLPEPLLLVLARRALASEATAIKIGHALQARSEMAVIAEELDSLARATNVSVPATTRLRRHLDPDLEPEPDGSSELPVDTGAVWIALAVLAVTAAASAWLLL